jgi:hypothetical protein
MAVISYAAASTANSVEAAELKRKQPDAVIPSADTIFRYLATNEVEDVLRVFRQINSELLAVTGMPKEPVDIAVDFHDCPYYGDKNDPSVRGIKPRNGYSPICKSTSSRRAISGSNACGKSTGEKTASQRRSSNISSKRRQRELRVRLAAT